MDLPRWSFFIPSWLSRQGVQSTVRSQKESRSWSGRSTGTTVSHCWEKPEWGAGLEVPLLLVWHHQDNASSHFWESPLCGEIMSIASSHIPRSCVARWKRLWFSLPQNLGARRMWLLWTVQLANARLRSQMPRTFLKFSWPCAVKRRKRDALCVRNAWSCRRCHRVSSENFTSKHLPRWSVILSLRSVPPLTMDWRSQFCRACLILLASLLNWMFFAINRFSQYLNKGGASKNKAISTLLESSPCDILGLKDQLESVECSCLDFRMEGLGVWGLAWGLVLDVPSYLSSCYAAAAVEWLVDGCMHEVAIATLYGHVMPVTGTLAMNWRLAFHLLCIMTADEGKVAELSATGVCNCLDEPFRYEGPLPATANSDRPIDFGVCTVVRHRALEWQFQTAPLPLWRLGLLRTTRVLILDWWLLVVPWRRGRWHPVFFPSSS